MALISCTQMSSAALFGAILAVIDDYFFAWSLPAKTLIRKTHCTRVIRGGCGCVAADVPPRIVVDSGD